MKLSLQLIVSIPLSTTLASQLLRVLGVLVLLGWHAKASVITIDNQDPALKYSGGWSPIPTSRETSGFNMLTRVPGARVTYTFEGIGIAVIGDQGTQGGNATVSTYSIDGGPTSTYSVQLNPPEMQFGVKFFDSGSNLNNGQHTLTITSLNNQAWFWLDTLQVTKVDPPPTSPGTTTTSLQVTTAAQQSVSSGTTTTSTGSTSSGTTTTSTVSTSSGTTTTPTESTTSGTTDAPAAISTTPISATTSTQADSAPSKSSVITAGALAGIILGGVTLFGLFIVGGIFWLRRRRRKRLLLAANILPGSSGSGEAFMSSRQEQINTDRGYPVPYRIEAFSGSGYLDGRTQQGATREKGGGNAIAFSNSAQTGGTIESVPFSGAPPAATQSVNPLSAPSSSGTQTSSDMTRATRLRRVSTDGGVRIAGGPPGVDINDEELDDSMTLPPVYRQY